MKVGKNNAKLPDIETFIKAGIDPKSRLPLKFTNTANLESEILMQLRILDEQTAVNRGRWHNLPDGISSQELERLLYYYGDLAFFYMEDLDKFFFMPYALDGTIDFYGRYNTIHPVPIANGTTDDEKKRYAQQLNVLSRLKLNCVYDVVYEADKVTPELLTKSCVLLHDYTNQRAQKVIPRQQVNDGLLKAMSEIIPMMRTGLLANSGIKGMRVQDEDQETAVLEANRAVEIAAKQGKPWIPIIGTIDFQELTATNSAMKSEEYMIALQSLDNFRLSLYGIDNGGLFEKKAHELKEEAAINGSNVGLVLQDKVSISQRFCNIVNSIWGLGIWYEPSENITNLDTNGDGAVYDRDEEGVEYDESSSDNE